MKEEKRGLEQALDSAKDSRLEAEKELRRVKLDLESNQESLTIMQGEHKMLSDDITQKMAELHASERRRAELEKECIELRPLKQRLSDIEEQVREVLDKKTKSDGEVTKLKLQIRDLENDVQSKVNEAKEV